MLARADTVCLTSCLAIGQVAAITGTLYGLPYPGVAGYVIPAVITGGSGLHEAGPALVSGVPVWFWHNTSAGHLWPRRCCQDVQPVVECWPFSLIVAGYLSKVLLPPSSF